MCHGFPKIHPCGHVSMKWLYCPSVVPDPTGRRAPMPCGRQVVGEHRDTRNRCRVRDCTRVVAETTAWTCCACGGTGHPASSWFPAAG